MGPLLQDYGNIILQSNPIYPVCTVMTAWFFCVVKSKIKYSHPPHAVIVIRNYVKRCRKFDVNFLLSSTPRSSSEEHFVQQEH